MNVGEVIAEDSSVLRYFYIYPIFRFLIYNYRSSISQLPIADIDVGGESALNINLRKVKF